MAAHIFNNEVWVSPLADFMEFAEDDIVLIPVDDNRRTTKRLDLLRSYTDGPTNPVEAVNRKTTFAALYKMQTGRELVFK